MAAIGEKARKRTIDTVATLTVQEAYTARLASQGHTNAEVGAQLYLSMRTVEWHLSKIFSELGGGSAATCPPHCNTWLRPAPDRSDAGRGRASR